MKKHMPSVLKAVRCAISVAGIVSVWAGERTVMAALCLYYEVKCVKDNRSSVILFH